MSNERILLVDDDPGFTDLLRGYLETAGFEGAGRTRCEHGHKVDQDS